MDEADKAPPEVVFVLKSLLEDGFLLLGDGRKVVSASEAAARRLHGDAAVVPIHPDFRMIVLANRPGRLWLSLLMMRSIEG